MKKLIGTLGISLAMLLSACGNEESDGAARVEEPTESVDEVSENTEDTENVEDTEEKSDIELAAEGAREKADEASRKAEESAREYLESNDIDTDEESKEDVDPFEHADTFPTTVGNVDVEALSYETHEDELNGEEHLVLRMVYEVDVGYSDDIIFAWLDSELTLNTGETGEAKSVSSGITSEMSGETMYEGSVEYRFEDTELSELEWADVKIPDVLDTDEEKIEDGGTVRVRYLHL